MKLNIGAIEGFLQKRGPDVCAFLSFGSDNGLVHEAALQVAKSINPDLDDPFNVVYLTAEQVKADPGSILMNANTGSLMGGQKLIIIRNVGDGVTAAMKEFLEEANGGFVVLFGPDLTRRSTLVQLMEGSQRAVAVGCYADDAGALRQLVTKTFSENGVKAEADTVSFLVSKLGADRKLTRSELDKLLTYLGDEKELTLEAAMACIDDAAATSFDDLATALVGRDARGISESLEKLAGEGESEVSILRITAGFLKRFSAAVEEYSRSCSIPNGLSAIKPRLNFKVEARIKSHIPRWSIKAMRKGLGVLVQAEINCKTTDYPPMLVCERALLQVATLR